MADKLEKLIYSVKYLPQVLYFGSAGLLLLDAFLDVDIEPIINSKVKLVNRQLRKKK